MKITIHGIGMFLQNISRNFHFQVMVFLWILINIKLSFEAQNIKFWETWMSEANLQVAPG